MFNKKLNLLSNDIINGNESFFEQKVENLKKLSIDTRSTHLDGSLNIKFAVQRISENEFQILDTYSNSILAITLVIEQDKFTYSELPNSTVKIIKKLHIERAINKSIDMIQNQQ